MNIITLLFQVLSLFIMMGFGLFARKKNFINAEVKRGMTEILIKIVTPAIVITSFSRELERDKITNALIVFAGAIVIHLILCFISVFLFKKQEKDRRAVMRFALLFGNFGFMGYPVLQSLFGLDGVFYGAMFNAAFYMFSWSFGVSIFTKSTGFKETLKSIFNVPFIAVIIGFLMYISPFRLPEFIQSPIDAIGAMNTPLSMLIIGSTFADIKFKDIFTDAKVYLIASLRLLAVPLGIALAIVIINLTGLLSLKGIPYEVMLVEEAMPCAAYCAIFATKYNSDVKLASKIVAIATALSILTVPLIVTIINALGI